MPHLRHRVPHVAAPLRDAKWRATSLSIKVASWLLLPAYTGRSLHFLFNRSFEWPTGWSQCRRATGRMPPDRGYKDSPGHHFRYASTLIQQLLRPLQHFPFQRRGRTVARIGLVEPLDPCSRYNFKYRFTAIIGTPNVFTISLGSTVPLPIIWLVNIRKLRTSCSSCWNTGR